MEHRWKPTDDDVRFFTENGYWISPQIIDEVRLEMLRERMDRIHHGTYETGTPPLEGSWNPGGDPHALRQTNNAFWSDLGIRHLATDPMIGEIAAMLMRASSIRVWHDQMLYKPGTDNKAAKMNGGNVGWHQDYFYWQCAEQPTLLTAWVAFDDVDLNNGCMQVLPRSNHWGLLSGDFGFYNQDFEEQKQKVTLPEGERFEPVPLVMRAGQISFHHALTMHGSGPNLTNRPRRSLTIHLQTGETRYKKRDDGLDRHTNVTLTHPNDGDLFDSDRWFPLLYQQPSD